MSALLQMAEQLVQRRAGFSLPRPFYTDGDYCRLELEHLFYQAWLFAGHEAELVITAAKQWGQTDVGCRAAYSVAFARPAAHVDSPYRSASGVSG